MEQVITRQIYRAAGSPLTTQTCCCSFIQTFDASSLSHDADFINILEPDLFFPIFFYLHIFLIGFDSTD